GEQANRIFATLDGAARKQALLDATAQIQPRTKRLQGAPLNTPGLPVGTLDDPQKQMVQQLLRDLTRPFRCFDLAGVQACLRTVVPADKLRLSFLQNRDLGDDRLGDAWKLEGPAFSWYFHGSPHIHSWVNILPSHPAPPS